MKLTDRQVSALLCYFYRSPTLEQLAKRMKLKGKRAALTHVHALWRKGMLWRVAPYQRKGYRITKAGKQWLIEHKYLHVLKFNKSSPTSAATSAPPRTIGSTSPSSGSPAAVD